MKYPLESSHSPPNHTRARVPALRAPSMACFSLANEAASITAPMKFWKSRTSPTRTCDRSEESRSCRGFHSERGTYARLAAEHFWPWYSNAPRTSATESAATSAEGCAKTKSLPPVSPTRRGYCL
jgi:hypothetical protein